MRARGSGAPRLKRKAPTTSKFASIRKKHDSPSPESKPNPPVPAEVSKRFRVLVAVHRPRYRARTERAMLGFDWEVRSLLNKQDPIGMIQQKPPHIFVISDDFGRQKDLGILRAAQRFRDSGMKIIALFESGESAANNAELCDCGIAPPWKTADMRVTLTDVFANITGAHAVTSEAEFEVDGD